MDERINLRTGNETPRPKFGKTAKSNHQIRLEDPNDYANYKVVI